MRLSQLYGIFFLLSFLSLLNCQNKRSSDRETVNTDSIITDSVSAKDYKQMAEDIAYQTIIVDGHVDLAYRLRLRKEDVSRSTYFGNFDYPKAKSGGLDAPFIPIYVPAAYENNGAKQFAFNQIKMIKNVSANHPGKFSMVSSPWEIEKNFKKGIISFPMGIENGAPIEGDLQNVQYFYDLGVRYITLCHSKNNHICDASYDKRRKWNGLSPFGKKLIPEMNKVGMMIDISHLSDRSAHQVLERTTKPVIASHSSCRHFTPGLERNLSDDLMEKLAANDGILMINFGSYFLDSDYRKAYKAINRWRKKHHMNMYDTAILTYAKNYNDSVNVFGSVSDVADHIDHAVTIMGIDHVGFGSDYDGIGWLLPECLRDVAGYTCLIEELLRRGYAREEIEKICYKNIFRVWSANEE